MKEKKLPEMTSKLPIDPMDPKDPDNLVLGENMVNTKTQGTCIACSEIL